MGNPTAPIVKITLDKERHLLLDLNAMVDFEEATGKSLLKATGLGDMGMKDIRALLWACLKHEDEKLTLKQVGSMIHASNLEVVSQSIEKAFVVAMPIGKGEAEPPLT